LLSHNLIILFQSQRDKSNCRAEKSRNASDEDHDQQL
jgi:hypothetical protein